jgi:hypothetical protein
VLKIASSNLAKFSISAEVKFCLVHCNIEKDSQEMSNINVNSYTSQLDSVHNI